MSKRNGLLVRNAEGHCYFWPMQGDGEFGSLSLVEVVHTSKELNISFIRAATYDEQCRICNAHQQYMFWYKHTSIPKQNGISGALLLCRKYPSGIIGKIPMYPKLTKVHSGGDLV